MLVILNIPEKSELGHFLIQDYFIYGSYIILKNNLTSLYSSQSWGSGGGLICPKPQSWAKAELKETTTSGSAQVPLHRASKPSADMPDGSPQGIPMLPEAPGWDDYEATRKFLTQPLHLPTGNEPSGLWKPFPDSLLLQLLFTTRKVHEAWFPLKSRGRQEESQQS